MKFTKCPKELNVPRLYLAASGKYYYKFRVNGHAGCEKVLDARTPAMCRQEADRKQVAHDAARNELIDPRTGAVYVDPFENSGVERTDSPPTVGAIIEAWRAAGWPDFDTLRPLPFHRREEYESKLLAAGRFFWDDDPTQLRPKSLDDFFEWRTKDAKPGTLLRATDTALSKLSALLTWAVRREIIESNPIRQKRRYQLAADVVHCTEFMPASDDELHRLGRWFFEQDETNPNAAITEALGWQMFFEAFTGGRTLEVVRMRMDASEGEAGFINWPLEYLNIDRCKSGIFPYVPLESSPGHKPLVALIQAHREWHRRRFGASCLWYFPNRQRDGHVYKSSLSHALTRASKELGLPCRTSHGMRAFYVRTCRSLGLDDTEISIRLGHRSGVALVEKTYGLPEHNWRGARLQDWMPATPAEVAWNVFTKTAAQERPPLRPPLSLSSALLTG